ncbi:MAG: hypothetical protein AAFN79_07855 [Pseudomonadota bacterium]
MSAIIYQTDRIADDATTRLAGTEGLAVARIDSGVYLYATARAETALNVYALTGGGSLSSVQLVGTRSNRIMDGIGDAAVVETPDGPHLVTAVKFENGLQGYVVRPNGDVRPTTFLQDDVIPDPVDEETPTERDSGGALALHGADSLANFELNGVAHVAVGSTFEGGIALLRYLEGGVIEHVSNVFDDASTHLTGVDDIAIAETTAGRFLAAVSPDEQGVSVYRVLDDGTFVNTFNLATGPEISLGVLTQVATVAVGDDHFVFIGGRGNWPITAFRLEDDGTLTRTDRVTGAEAANIFNTYALETFETDGKTFLAVGSDRGGVSVFRVGDGGGLTLVHEDGHLNRRVSPTDELRVEQFGDKTFIIAGGGPGDGITVSRFFTAPKGEGVIGGAANDRLVGTPKGDVLIGDAGNDNLKGKSGHDRVLDGFGKDIVFGGPGRDVFEFTHDDQQDKLRDFQDGLDRIDLSDDPGVDDIDDLVFTQVNANNVRIEVDGELLFVRGFQNSPLAVADLGAEDFIF